MPPCLTFPLSTRRKTPNRMMITVRIASSYQQTVQEGVHDFQATMLILDRNLKMVENSSVMDSSTMNTPNHLCFSQWCRKGIRREQKDQQWTEKGSSKSVKESLMDNDTSSFRFNLTSTSSSVWIRKIGRKPSFLHALFKQVICNMISSAMLLWTGEGSDPPARFES